MSALLHSMMLFNLRYISTLVHYLIISLVHYLIISLVHYLIISLVHYLIISLVHYLIISLVHYLIISLVHSLVYYLIISLVHYLIISISLSHWYTHWYTISLAWRCSRATTICAAHCLIADSSCSATSSANREGSGEFLREPGENCGVFCPDDFLLLLSVLFGSAMGGLSSREEVDDLEGDFEGEGRTSIDDRTESVDCLGVVEWAGSH